ncbi:MAG: response regulator [Lachnospiraceae bacterium]|nr:response regulator [Lachnospiraceae bacterium]
MRKAKKYVQVLANGLLVLGIVFFLIGLCKPGEAGEAYIGSFDTFTFNENWTLRQGEDARQVTLPMVVSCNKDETIVLENVIPTYVKDGMRLFLRTALQEVEVYIDGISRGSYCVENLEHVKEYPPSAYVMVDLVSQDAEKSISVHFKVKNQGNLNEIRIGYGNNAWFAVLYKNIPMAVAAVVLIMIGILAILAHFFTRNKIKKGNAVLFLGQTMLVIGLWSISESNMRQLLFASPSYSAIFAYILIEIVTGFIGLYFNEIQKYKYQKAYMLFVWCVFLQAFLNVVLSFCGLAELHTTLVFSHIWMGVGIVLFIVTVSVDIVTKRIREYSVAAGGMLLFILFCILEIVGFYLFDFHLFGIYLGIGLIVLLVFTILQAVLEEFEKIRLAAQKEKFQAELEARVEEQTEELRIQQQKMKRLFEQTVTALSEAVDAKDRYTCGHSKRVAKYARMLAERLGKSKAEQEAIYHAGLLHDVGKIRIPAEIINKPGRLTEEEYNIIKIHPLTGYHILRGISDGDYIAVAAKYHHERYDGKGYPNGLSGENIPEVARILGVADAYDAMASNRSYREALPQEIVRSEIEKGMGTQFDPHIAKMMLQMIDEDKNYAMKQIDSMQRRILTVDDEMMNNKIIEHIMKDEPMYQLVSAGSGLEALKILEGCEFDLILLDVKMPGMDGLETLKRIREKYRTPVVLMTGDKTLDISAGFAEYGCDDYITKPFLPLLVKEIVHNMTERTDIGI